MSQSQQHQKKLTKQQLKKIKKQQKKHGS